MSDLTLYNITNKFVDLMDRVENGELTEEEYNKLGEELAIELQNKSSSIIGYVRNSELLIEAMKAEEKRISDLRKVAENKIEKFKQYVKENMEKLGLEKIQTDRKRSIKYKFIKLLCRECHSNENIINQLRIDTQKEYEKSHTKEEFIKLIGKSYL